jgi:hypothetical protein
VAAVIAAGVGNGVGDFAAAVAGSDGAPGAAGVDGTAAEDAG